jgi:TRAP-type C4-dicarboxylate transport system permease large subunit
VILGAADAMAWALIQSGLSDTLAHILSNLPGGGFGFLLVSIPLFVVFGSFLEGLPAIALFGPLLFPIARSLGVHDVQFAMVAILSMGIGLYMPPFGVGYYSACAIGGVPPDTAVRQIWPYLGVLLLVTILIAAVPAFSTVLLP